MSILDRLNLLVRSNLNETFSKNDEYVRDAVHDMEHSLRDARKQLALLQKDEQKMLKSIRQVRQKADQWEDRAMLALKNGDEDLAREAIMVKNETLDKAFVLREKLDEHRAHMRDISSALEALEIKLDSTQSRSRIHKKRTSSNDHTSRTEVDWDLEMKRRMASREGDSNSDDQSSSSPYRRSYRASSTDTSSGEDGTLNRKYADRQASDELNYHPKVDNTFREFDRMSDKISSMEAHIAAAGELDGDDLIDPRKSQLNKIFKEMETKRRTSDDLEDLKKKFS